jgi:hypothetical protein
MLRRLRSAGHYTVLRPATLWDKSKRDVSNRPTVFTGDGVLADGDDAYLDDLMHLEYLRPGSRPASPINASRQGWSIFDHDSWSFATDLELYRSTTALVIAEKSDPKSPFRQCFAELSHLENEYLAALRGATPDQTVALAVFAEFLSIALDDAPDLSFRSAPHDRSRGHLAPHWHRQTKPTIMGDCRPVGQTGVRRTLSTASVLRPHDRVSKRSRWSANGPRQLSLGVDQDRRRRRLDIQRERRGLGRVGRYEYLMPRSIPNGIYVSFTPISRGVLAHEAREEISHTSREEYQAMVTATATHYSAALEQIQHRQPPLAAISRAARISYPRLWRAVASGTFSNLTPEEVERVQRAVDTINHQHVA